MTPKKKEVTSMGENLYKEMKVVAKKFVSQKEGAELYDALYHAANRTLSELSADPKYLGAQTGYICVLHTWGSKMNYHPHLHTIVLGGGLDKRKHWTDKNGKMFFPVKLMSAVFKNHYLTELKSLWETGQLESNEISQCRVQLSKFNKA